MGEFLAGGLGELAAVTARMRQLEPLLADPAALAEYGRVQERWTVLEGWSAQARLDVVRQRLDIARLPDGLPLARVSGGEQARVLAGAGAAGRAGRAAAR